MNGTQSVLERFTTAFIPIMHFFHNLASSISRGTDFSLAQYRVLMLVNHRGAMSINDLRTQLNIAQSSASEMVNRLVQAKMLVREKSPTDRRMTIFKLTAEAKQVILNRKKNTYESLDKILEPFSAEEQQELIQAFETIHRLIQQYNPIQKK